MLRVLRELPSTMTAAVAMVDRSRKEEERRTEGKDRQVGGEAARAAEEPGEQDGVGGEVRFLECLSVLPLRREKRWVIHRDGR